MRREPARATPSTADPAATSCQTGRSCATPDASVRRVLLGGPGLADQRASRIGVLPQIAIDRPQDAAYNLYALTHVRDLIRRFRPDVLWNDMDWPDSGKRDGRDGLADLFRDYYAAVPDGVVNDRWGVPHHDFRSTEYSTGSDVESGDETWEHTRGLGLSFGYNRVEGADVTMDSPALARHWVDVVARGGRLLINVGPTADGVIPPLQRATLEGFALWRDRLGDLDPGAVVAGEAAADEQTWVRHWRTQDAVAVSSTAPDLSEFRSRPTLTRAGSP